MVSIDGSELRRITDSPGNEGSPDFSPDGSRIAFVSNRDGNSEIYIMNADGSDQRRLTHYPGDGDEYFGNSNPSFSPDGTKIAFTSIRKETDSEKENGEGEYVKVYYREIYIINIDGSDEKCIFCYDEDKWKLEPWGYLDIFFSPDGTRIAYRPDWWSEYGIVAMNIDGSGYEKLFSIYRGDEDFCISPDWSKIAIDVSSRFGAEEVSGIYLYDIDDELREHGINLSNNPASD